MGKYEINSDCYFTSGKLLKHCQDYAIHDDNPFPYIILSDGCSSSKNTDIGARILCHCAKNAITKVFKDLDTVNEKNLKENLYELVGQMTISFAYSSIINLRLSDECLNATLIICFIIDDKIVTYKYGDGFNIFMTKDKIINFIKYSEFKGNAPYYLTYWMNYENRKLFEEAKIDENGNETELRTDFYDYSNKLSTKTILSHLDHDVKIYPLDESIILIASDGLSAFKNKMSGERLNYKEVLKEFTNFKSTDGHFIQKRLMNAMNKFFENGIVNEDDVSMAGFAIKGT